MAAFTLFSDARFPSEIRDMIWGHAIANIPPRTIELHGGISDTISGQDGLVINVEFGFIANTPVPAVLHACSRSRELAMKRWTLAFDSRYRMVRHPDDGDVTGVFQRIPRTWFDFEADTLLFLEHNSMLQRNAKLRDFKREIEYETRKRVKNIAFNLSSVMESDFISDSADGDEGEQIARCLHWVFPQATRYLVVCAGDPDDMQYELDKGFVPAQGMEDWESRVIEEMKAAFVREEDLCEVSMDLVEFASDVELKEMLLDRIREINLRGWNSHETGA